MDRGDDILYTKLTSHKAGSVFVLIFLWKRRYVLLKKIREDL
jgi:hypothetical protein